MPEGLITAVDRLPWTMAVQRMNWGAGEHVTLVGPTGAGKTELEVALMRERHWVVFLNTKRKDSTQHELHALGYQVIRTPAELNADVHNHYIFSPPSIRRTSIWVKRGAGPVSAGDIKAGHRAAYGPMLMTLREQMGWTICADEVHYLTSFLGLSDEMELLWMQGRSERTTVIANTQRPRHIPLVAYSQAKHLFFWSSPDLADVRRIGEMTPLPIQAIVAILSSQNEHDVLYVNARTGDMFQTNTRW